MTTELHPDRAEPPPVCLLAGGLGTRLGPGAVPKPIREVAGEPFLFHQLRSLRAAGLRRVVLCVGYLGELIESTVGPERFGIEVAYSYDVGGLEGTLGAIRRARELLGAEFLVLYGDTFLRVDYAATWRAWRASGLPGLMTVLRNEGQWDTSNVIYADGLVVRYDKGSPDPAMAWIDYGLGGLRAETLGLVPDDEADVAVLYAELARRGELFGYEVNERFYEIGTPSALEETDRFLRDLRGRRIRVIVPGAPAGRAVRWASVTGGAEG